MSVWAAAAALLGLIVITGVLILVLVKVLMGEPPPGGALRGDITPREVVAVAPLAVLSLLIGIVPALLIGVIEVTTGVLASLGV